PSAQVMTPDHLGKVARRLLAKIGIRIGSGEQIAADAGPPITFIGKSVTGESAEDRSAQVESSKGYMSARELVYDAIVRRATDVHLEPTEDEFAVRLRIDGVMQPGEAFSTDTGQAVLNVVKVLSAMDITERRKPQDGSFRAEVEGRRIDFRVATQGTGGGEKVSLRILDQGNTPIDLKRLGMRKSVLDPIMATLAQPHGLMIVCGPTGAGKSTTLYAALHTFDRTERNIITIEDPIEYRLGGINQIEIDRGAGQTFATTLRSVLRQDPDVVLVGEIRDAETAEIACQAANTGHLVLSTIHANDTLTALYRLVELGIDTHTVANALSAVVGQRLVRKLCPDCKIPYAVKPEAIERVGLSSQQVRRLFRAQQDANSICETCSGTGYLGRVGVFEVLTVTERIGEMVRERASLPAIRAEARKAGLKSMKEDGLRLAVKGLTSMDELLRVTK
ncbi:MAG: GspE/PulE family protein, partial [Planctomycetota bacterium]